MLRNTPERWGAVAVALHWLLAALIFIQFALGWLAVLWRLSPTKLDLFVWHKSLGMVALALVLVRIGWRLVNPTPALPASTPQWEHWAARGGHTLLYLLMLGMPISGWLISSASNVPFQIFWQVPLPDLFVGPDKAIEAASKQAHLIMFIVLAVVIVLHIAAALRHHFRLHDNVLVRMLPLLRVRP